MIPPTPEIEPVQPGEPVATRRLRRDDRGSALIELVWLGILLLVPTIWILTSIFQVQAGAFAVTGAARAAGRAFALAPDDATGSVRARAAAVQVLADHGVAGTPTVQVTCGDFADCHSGTAVIDVVVATKIKLPLLPDVFGGGAPSFALDARHSVPIGRFQEVTR